MRAVIVEDEALVANNLRKLIGDTEPETEILAVLPSLKAALDWFGRHPEPDLVFMDIQLSDGVSFDLFKSISLQCPIIFTTAYNEYAIRAFKVNSIDYLLKPVDREDLQAAFQKFHRLQKQQPREDFRGQLELLLRDLQGGGAPRKYKERFMVHARNRIIPVAAGATAYFFKEEIIFLVTTDGQRHVSDYHTMEELEHVLDPAAFFRANRQYILHLQSIESIRTHATGKLTVRLKPPLNVEIDISREKAPSFKDWLG